MKQAGKITKISLEERQTTFKEVSNGFSEDEMLKEADRCLQCPTGPCQKGCPAGIDICLFIKYLRNKEYDKALMVIRQSNSLPAVCGRVCPQEEQCQLECVLNKSGNPIQIGYLERWVSDWALANGVFASDKPVCDNIDRVKVAVIGSGPAGLTCAADLAKECFDVTLFEGLHKTGGVLTYGIPEFRLPKIIVEKEAEYIKSLGVNIKTDVVIGRTKTIDELKEEGFKAFYIAAGAGLPRFMNIPGENLNGVYSANEFLTRINLMKAYRFPEYDTPIEVSRDVIVLGAGNVAFDCVRSAMRLKGVEKVTIAYRRTREEMPAREEEIENAEEEAVNMELLVSPKELIADENGRVREVHFVRNKLGEPDDSGRRRPVEIKGSDFILKADTVIVAIGTTANPLIISAFPGLEMSKRGYINTNEEFHTNIPGVFAGGDIVSGSATVIKAIRQGKEAATAIQQYLST